MAEPHTALAPEQVRAAGAQHPVVVAHGARTETERDLIRAWAEREYPGAALVRTNADELAAFLGQDDTLVVPARVTWLPSERKGDRRVRLADLIALTNPRRPWAVQQRVIVRRSPDRARVVAGEPARVGAMRDRFRIEAGGDEAAFAAFVSRQATLACARAERQLLGDRYKVPRLVAEQITASARFRSRAAELAHQLGRSEQDVLDQATRDLSEVAAVQSPLAIDAFRLMMSPMHAPAWDVQVDADTLERLRELNRRHALVFLPTHRSYADPLVFAEVMHGHDFPRTHIIGGNNLAFWPIGPLGKRAGAVFIRRKIGDDPVYKLALREYLGYLVSKRFNLEWYIEGGRSRTGKLRAPSFGLLHYLVSALEDDRADDVMCVPVSMVYDQLQEVGAMAAEQLGATKKAEGLLWWARYIRGQLRNNGTARVRFGEPFSLRTALVEAGEGSTQLEKVAFRICDGINRATPVTATALVTFALLGTRDRALTLDQIVEVTTPLLDYIERREIPGPVAELSARSGLAHTLNRLVADGVATRYDGGTAPVWSIRPGQHPVAAFYRNGAVHYLVNRAIVELALLHIAGDVGGDPLQAAWTEALRLRDLLKFEFFFPLKRQFGDEIIAELELLDPNWRDRVGSPATATELLRSSRMLVAHRSLRPFVDAQLVVARRLDAHDPRSSIDRKVFVDECVGVGHQMLLQGQLHRADAVSTELFSAALQLADNRALLGGEDAGELRRRRRAFLAEVEDVLSRLGRIGELDTQLLDAVLDDHG